MDPLSITVSAITLLGTVKGISKGLQKLVSLRRASDLVLALINELEDFQIILNVVQSVITQRESIAKAPAGLTGDLNSLLERSKGLLEEIQVMTDGLLASHGSKEQPRLSRIKWLKRQSALQPLQKELEGIKHSISALLAAAVSSDVLRVELRLDEIAGVSLIAQVQQAQALQVVTQQLKSQELLLSDIRSQIPPRHQGQPASPSKDSVAGTGDIGSIGGLVCVKSSYCLFGGYTSCLCHCHRRGSHLRSPKMLDRLLGTLFASYVGRPRGMNACLEGCHHQGGSRLRITHFFPHWFFMGKFTAVVSRNLHECLHTSVMISRQISPKSSVFQLCRAGDLEGLKDLFTRELASPFDVSAQTGSSVLTHAVMGCHGDVCRFLIESGADPFAENMFGKRPIDDALDLILTSQLQTDAFDKFLSNGEFYEDKQFSVVHKVATELLPLDLSAVLYGSSASSSSPTSSIDMKDADGRTALAWAAGRCNISILRTLLSFAADPNSKDRLGAVPLFAAVKSGPLASVQLLLSHGADVNARDHWGNNSLHVAALRRREADMAQLLITAGADLDQQDRTGWTPLCAAIFWDTIAIVEILIASGADLENRDSDGMTPLLLAVYHNRAECVGQLLSAGADISAVTKRRRSILHIAAEAAGIYVLEKLETHLARSRGSVNLEPTAKDSGGKTAMEIFEKSERASTSGLRIAFERLIATISIPVLQKRTKTSTTSSYVSLKSDTDIESVATVWEDAEEFLKPGVTWTDIGAKRKRGLRVWLGLLGCPLQ